MIGKTLSIYISIRFLKILAGMVAGLVFLIVTVDFIEQLRKASDVEDVTLWQLYSISLMRAPVFVEKAFPFGCLFAAMITLTQLNLKMELVVARSAGVSAWQFLLPIGISAIFVGVFVATVYNPLAILAFQKSQDLSAAVLEKKHGTKNKDTESHYWIKQQDEQGVTTYINAAFARDNGKLLTRVKFLKLDETGGLEERVDALRASYQGDHWQLEEARINRGGVIISKNLIKLETKLTENDLLGVSAKPDGVSFWELQEVSKRLEKSGTNGNPYLVQYHSLTALPMFLLAMILVAATVCLRFVRFGQVGRMILGGIMFGFVLYIITSLITALGSNGVVPPAVAAWAPGFVAILFGISALLHQEDG